MSCAIRCNVKHIRGGGTVEIIMLTNQHLIRLTVHALSQYKQTNKKMSKQQIRSDNEDLRGSLMLLCGTYAIYPCVNKLFVPCV